MRKRKYILTATIALSLAIATGCSSAPENTKADASTSHEVSTEAVSSTDTESTSENNTLSSDDNASIEDVPATEETTIPDSQNGTAPSDTDNSGNTGSSNSSTNANNNNNNTSTGNNSSNNNNNSNQNNNNNASSITNLGYGNVVSDKNSDKIVASYGGSATTEAKTLAQAVVNKIITKGMSDFEKAKAIFDYMVMNIDYDYDNYLADTIPDASYTALGALKNKYAVCAGYAKAFKLLCELSGLECDYVTGTAGGPHAWNQVKIDGKWYNVDVTWGDPVSKGKDFNDHTFNNYGYFLISDELMYKDHTAKNAQHTCSSSLNLKAYEVGAPWLADTNSFVKNEAELISVVEKAVKSNSTSISITWDTNWIKVHDMCSTIKGMIREFAQSDYSMGSYTYYTVKNTTYCSSTFTVNLKNGTYTPIDKLCTKEDIKKFVLELINDTTKDQLTVPMANSIVDDDIFYEVAVWAFDTYDYSIQFSVTEIPVNSTTSAVHVYAGENNYDGEHHTNKAYRVKTSSDIINVMAKYHADSLNSDFRIVYRYGDELGKLSADELDAYIKKNLAPTWAAKYCYENYSVGTNDFICVTVINFYNPCHSSKGMSWEYAKEPTCIEGGVSILKCAKCGNITQSYEEEPTGEHTTYWVYDSDTTRHLACKHCTYTGPVLQKYGAVWGYFDDTAAKETFTAVNVRRANECFREDDDYGNYIGTYYAPQLTWNDKLASLVRTYAVCVATSYINGEPVNSPAYTLYTFSADTPEQAAKALFSGVTPYYDILGNRDLLQAGTSCFYYDSDGTGLKMKRVWCIYLSE